MDQSTLRISSSQSTNLEAKVELASLNEEMKYLVDLSGIPPLGGGQPSCASVDLTYGNLCLLCSSVLPVTPYYSTHCFTPSRSHSVTLLC
ncbi:hypothetical protein LZ31DRAFT_550413 [Colletotrichum somersetense]|nr:hypothetical protein LZ31DRAFT_550413 [Colletotrichum somersetense]